MSLPRTLRKIHYWTSLPLLFTIFVIALTGSLLALKKDFDALQPPTREGTPGLPERPLADLARAVAMVPGHGQVTWQDIDRIDIRPSDGIAKVILNSRTEVQVDLATGRPVQLGYRTSDLLETIHDFSLIGDWAKYALSLGSGIALLLMSGTGVYLFLLPMLVKRRKRRARALAARELQAADVRR
jgi:uncharacterized iron-regulated membrane protein